MPTSSEQRQAALAEAHRRGILPPDVAASFEEAQRRGLVAGGEPKRPDNLFGIPFPTVEQEQQLMQQAERRRADSQASLQARGEQIIANDERQRRSPFSRQAQDMPFGLEKDRDPLKVGAEAVGGSQALTFNFGDEIVGLFNKDAGQKSGDLAKFARETQPGAYGKGELGGTLINAAVSLPVTAASRLPQLARFIPGGKVTKSIVGTGAATAVADTIWQSGQGEGNPIERVQGTDKGQTAIAAGLGGALGLGVTLVTALTRPLSREASQLSNVLNGVVDEGSVSPDGLRSLERFLRDQNAPLDRVALDRINSALNDVGKLGADAAALPARLKDILIETLDGPSGNLANAVQKQLKGTVVAGDDGAKTITNAIDQDLPAAREYLQEGLQDTLGSQSRLGASDEISERLAAIGREGYEPLLRAGPTSRAGADALTEVLNGPGMMKAGAGNNTLAQPLKTLAAGEGMDLERFILERPLEAAHWMQSKARRLANSSADVTMRGAFGALRTRLLRAINKAAPGYDDIRIRYGDEFGNEQALSFGDKFLTKASQDLDVDVMAREFAQLSPAQREAALLSVRDALQSSVGRGRATNGPRLTRVTEEQVMTALPRVFGEAGEEVAAAIQKTDDFVQSRLRVDARRGSPTASNQEAAQFAKDTVMPPWRQKVGQAIENAASDTGVSAAFGHFVPFKTMRAASGALGRKIAGNPVGKMNDLAALLETRIAPKPGVSTNVLAEISPQPAPAAAGDNVLASLDNGLPMDQASRMGRAHAMGFDTETPLYHGTGREFESFTPGAQGATRRGAPVDTQEAVFLTTSPSVADAYGARSASRLDGGGRIDQQEIGRLSGEANAAVSAANRTLNPIKKYQQRKMVGQLRGQADDLRYKDVYEEQRTIQAFTRLENPRVIGDLKRYDKQAVDQLIKEAKDAGNDGLIIKGVYDEWGGEITDYHVVFDPKNIRSTSAKFDPAKSDSPIITAGLPGLQDLAKPISRKLRKRQRAKAHQMSERTAGLGGKGAMTFHYDTPTLDHRFTKDLIAGEDMTRMVGFNEPLIARANGDSRVNLIRKVIEMDLRGASQTADKIETRVQAYYAARRAAKAEGRSIKSVRKRDYYQPWEYTFRTEYRRASGTLPPESGPIPSSIVGADRTAELEAWQMRQALFARGDLNAGRHNIGQQALSNDSKGFDSFEKTGQFAAGAAVTAGLAAGGYALKDVGGPRQVMTANDAPEDFSVPVDVNYTTQDFQSFLGVDPDGKVGPKTRAVIKAYQSSKGFDQTGEIDYLTERELRRDLWARDIPADEAS